MRELLIEHSDGKTECALCEDRRLIDFLTFEQGQIRAGQIYTGIVQTHVKSLDAWFIQLPDGQMGFMPQSEARQALKSGQPILVQIKKPPVQQKAAYLTQDLSLPGKYLVYLPQSPGCKLSGKLEDEAEKSRLKSIGLQLAGKEKGGVILRSAAGQADKAQLETEYNELARLWEGIALQAGENTVPRLLYDGADAQETALREWGAVDRILTDNCFMLYEVRSQLKKACEHKIWLDCGAYLVIDVCEAMTVIDVNSGKNTNHSGNEETFLQVNLQAAQQIARLMRLRKMGGIIIVDFIDMKSDGSRERVSDYMKKLLLRDPVKCTVHGFTQLGLMEITRKKMFDVLK